MSRNIHSPEVWLITHERDERRLKGAERLPSAISIAESAKDAISEMIRMSGIGLADVRAYRLTYPYRDASEVAELLTLITGERFEVMLYEVDMTSVDSVDTLRSEILQIAMFGRL